LHDYPQYINRLDTDIPRRAPGEFAGELAAETQRNCRGNFDENDILQLLDGADPDICKKAERVVGADWLNAPTPARRAHPEQAIHHSQAFWVRDILRSTNYGEFS
jgi:hypothetical protein